MPNSPSAPGSRWHGARRSRATPPRSPVRSTSSISNASRRACCSESIFRRPQLFAAALQRLLLDREDRIGLDLDVRHHAGAPGLVGEFHVVDATYRVGDLEAFVVIDGAVVV